MKTKKLNYLHYQLFLCENSNGYYVSIEKDGKFIESTPYRNDTESAIEAAKNTVDYIVHKWY